MEKDLGDFFSSFLFFYCTCFWILELRSHESQAGGTLPTHTVAKDDLELRFSRLDLPRAGITGVSVPPPPLCPLLGIELRTLHAVQTIYSLYSISTSYSTPQLRRHGYNREIAFLHNIIIPSRHS